MFFILQTNHGGYPVGILLDWCLEQSKRLLCGPLVSQPPPEAPKRTGGASQGGVGIMWVKVSHFFLAPGHFPMETDCPKAEWDRSTACSNGSLDPPPDKQEDPHIGIGAPLGAQWMARRLSS